MKDEIIKKLYNILNLRENGGNWNVMLDEVLCFIMSFENENSPSYCRVYMKLSSCRYLDYKYFRSFIFDAIGELSRGGDNNELF